MIDINKLIIPAARVGDIQVLTELIAKKANVEIRDEKGYSPLIIACYNNQYAAAELLLNSGVDVKGMDNSDLSNYLHNLVFRSARKAL